MAVRDPNKERKTERQRPKIWKPEGSKTIKKDFACDQHFLKLRLIRASRPKVKLRLFLEEETTTTTSKRGNRGKFANKSYFGHQQESLCEHSGDRVCRQKDEIEWLMRYSCRWGKKSWSPSSCNIPRRRSGLAKDQFRDTELSIKKSLLTRAKRWN